MSASSWDGWAKLLVHPCVAMGYYFIFSAPSFMIAAYMCTGVRGEGHMYYVVLVPLVFYTFVSIASSICFWRWGPAVAHYKLYGSVAAFAILSTLPVTYVGYLGPGATMPWHNDFQWLVVSCLNVFSTLQVTSAGSVAGEHPAEPRTSIREPVLRSAVHAVMVLDAFSDLSLTRSLLRVVCSCCQRWCNSVWQDVCHELSAPVPLLWGEGCSLDPMDPVMISVTCPEA